MEELATTWELGTARMEEPARASLRLPNDLRNALRVLWTGLNGIGRPEEFSAWHSRMILRSVHVLVTLALGKHWAIDRSADPKGKLQLAIF